LKAAVFFDRDGTIIKSVHYLSDPDEVELIDGAAQVLRELEQEGYLRVVVTNQAAINKGILSRERLEQIHQRIGALLDAQGASIDGWYFCPEIRRSKDHETIDHPDRKPGPGMLLKAARDMNISLAESWMVGDTLSDALAGSNAGCKGSILIESGLYDPGYEAHPQVSCVVSKISDVPGIIRSREVSRDE
jgi:D-glycero-D-manno-heptose 1,7-bisphosphate phosphatase